MNKPIIVLRGKTTQKPTGNKHTAEITPFVGFEMIEKVPRLGFGFYTDSGSITFYTGSALPLKNIIQAWRAMLIIQSLRFVLDRMLSDIWNFAARVQSFPDFSSDIVVKAFDNSAALQKLRDSTLSSFPSNEELDKMVKSFLKNNVAIDIHEVEIEKQLTTEMQSPKIPPLISNLVEATQRLTENGMSGGYEDAVKLVGEEKTLAIIAALATYRFGITLSDTNEIKKFVHDYLLSRELI